MWLQYQKEKQLTRTISIEPRGLSFMICKTQTPVRPLLIRLAPPCTYTPLHKIPNTNDNLTEQNGSIKSAMKIICSLQRL